MIKNPSTPPIPFFICPPEQQEIKKKLIEEGWGDLL